MAIYEKEAPTAVGLFLGMFIKVFDPFNTNLTIRPPFLRVAKSDQKSCESIIPAERECEVYEAFAGFS